MSESQPSAPHVMELATQSSPMAEKSALWPAVNAVTAQLCVQLRMPKMTIRAAMALQPGMLLHSEHPEINDVAFGVAGVQLGWCEFSAIGDRIGIRLTRPA